MMRTSRNASGSRASTIDNIAYHVYPAAPISTSPATCANSDSTNPCAKHLLVPVPTMFPRLWTRSSHMLCEP
jgi:hypothetical protein